MKCPLYMAHLLREIGKVDLAQIECIKGGCAWWDEDRNQCSELSKIGALVALNSILAEISGKMPG